MCSIQLRRRRSPTVEVQMIFITPEACKERFHSGVLSSMFRAAWRVLLRLACVSLPPVCAHRVLDGVGSFSPPVVEDGKGTAGPLGSDISQRGIGSVALAARWREKKKKENNTPISRPEWLAVRHRPVGSGSCRPGIFLFFIFP